MNLNLVTTALFLLAGAAFPAQDEELEALLAEERQEAVRLWRGGEGRGAVSILNELLDEDPSDAESRGLRARIQFGRVEPQETLAEARRAFEEARGPARVTCGAILVEVETELGRGSDALATWKQIAWDGDPPLAAWLEGRAHESLGELERARAAYDRGAEGRAGDDWVQWLAKGRCQRRLGDFVGASITLVEGDRIARANGGAQADLEAELASLYFEVDGEVDIDVPRARLPGVRYKEALRLNEEHEAGLLGLYELHSFNWRRHSRSSGTILAELLELYPHSVRALLAGFGSALDNGHLPRAREFLEQLAEAAPDRRDVRAHTAALAWVEHRREDAREYLDALTESSPHDSEPERIVGEHLLELYRFQEGLPFLASAAERNGDDPHLWTQLGRAYANSGDEVKALESLRTAERVARGRQNAWRNNMRMVLEKLDRNYIEREHGSHTFVWEPAAAAILERYTVPFYAEAREELAERYGFTPGDVRIEFFGEHDDFSVRSTGFPGYSALGVCFGPVVTAVSPLAEMRRRFSWARTAFHEYTHVIHLGLSNNRCPRWITEGIATWEEEQRDPSWGRNMRRDLVDAHANGRIIPVRDLNAAFRGPRILFGYYQGGLLCEMLIGEHGFPPMIRLLEAFDRGLDLDQAFKQVFATTPEEVDRRFDEFVRGKIAGLAIEPRWNPSYIAGLSLRLPRRPPEDEAELAGWREGWVTVAWGNWQMGRRVDAEEALRQAGSGGELPPRGVMLRGEIDWSQGRRAEARERWVEALGAGLTDFRVQMALGSLAEQEGEIELAESYYLAAEEAFPGFAEADRSAELALVALYEAGDREFEAMGARERWLAYNAGDFPVRMQLADWQLAKGLHALAAESYRRANDVDPFDSRLHEQWGRALAGLEAWQDALEEFDVALAVPPELERSLDMRSAATPMDDTRRAEIEAWRAEMLGKLERWTEAREAAERALELDSACERARQVLELCP